MAGSEDNNSLSAVEHYWTVLPKYIAAIENGIALTHKIAGQPTESPRQYWASVLFVRLCSAGISVLHLCPGSPANTAGTHWDFSALAPLIRCLVQTGLMLFYLGTEIVVEDESRARLLTMQLRDWTERQHMFQNFGASAEKIREFQLAADHIRTELSTNAYFVSLPARLRKSLLKGDSASILTDDQILDRLGTLDQRGRAFLRFISSHADVSPLSYSRTGENNRGRGGENDTDEHYIATAIDLACDFILRANADMGVLFRAALAASSQRPQTAVSNERFELCLDFALQSEGGDIDDVTSDDDSGVPLLCSDCFHDEGLRLSSVRIGQRDMSKCPNCGSQRGMKLSRKAIAALARQFFVRGTIRRFEYGASPAVQFNKHRTTSIDVTPWLGPDLRLIERTLHVGFFYYGPRLWMAGEVEPLKALQKTESRGEVISRVLNEYPVRILNNDECFYRLRKAPANPGGFDQYDAPPIEMLGRGRFETAEFPILYGSQDLEVCLHECRAAADDELYIATLVPLRELKLLNLADVLWEENVTEFESLDMALHMLFLAGPHSYEISREIASAAQKSGFDGLVYPSYFTLLRTGAMPFETISGVSHRKFAELHEHIRKNTISNLALFGRPIADGSVKVQCINRVILNKVEYKLSYGPLLPRETSSNCDSSNEK